MTFLLSEYDSLMSGMLQTSQTSTWINLQAGSPLPQPVKEAQPFPSSQVRKIAVLAATDLAGFIFTLPALHALQIAYPGAEIVQIGAAWQKKFVSNRPGMAHRVEVLTAPYENGGPVDPAQQEELQSFVRRMQAEQLDIVLQIRDGGRCSNPFVCSLNGRLTAGLRLPDAPPLDRWIPYVYHQLQILRNLEVVSLVGAEPVGLEPRVMVTQEDVQEAARIYPQTSRPLAVLVPGAVDPRCQWPAEKFSGLGDALEWSGAQVVIAGSSAETDLCERVAAGMSVRAANLAGKLSLSGLTGLFARAAVVAANDSGLLQLANAAGAATVGIYWCGNLMATGPVTHTRHRTAISWQMSCPVCGLDSTRSDCGHTGSFLSVISREEVITQAVELLKSGGIQAAPMLQDGEEDPQDEGPHSGEPESEAREYEPGKLQDGNCAVTDNNTVGTGYPLQPNW